jgi:hypothetical protein
MPAEPPARPLVTPPARPPVEPTIEPPADPVFIMPSVVRQRNSGKSPPAHTVTVPPPSPSDRPRPAFTISDNAPRGGPHDAGPVFSVGDAAHVRHEPAFGGITPEPRRPQRDTREPHVPVVSRHRNAASQVFVANPPKDREPAYRPASAVESRQVPAGGIYVEPRRDGADTESRSAESRPIEVRPVEARSGGTRSIGTEFIASERSAFDGIMRVFWSVLIVAGLFFLACQLVYVYRAQIANTVPALRPVLEQACEPLHCKVPYSRQIDLISIMSSSLRAVAPADKGQDKAQDKAKGQDKGQDKAKGQDKGQDKAKSQEKDKDAASDSMMLQLTMRNQYDKAQEWPTLVLDLTDFSGTLVVRKNLPPQLYLSSETLQHPFAPASEITVSVPIAMNGQKINGYQLAKFFQ